MAFKFPFRRLAGEFERVRRDTSVLRVLGNEVDRNNAELEVYLTALEARIETLEATDTAYDTRLDALEATDAVYDTRLDALEATDAAYDTRLDALEADTTQYESVWVTYTPTVGQGVTANIAKTVTYAKYKQIGKTVIGIVRLDITGTGTAGQGVTVTLPVTSTTNNLVIGTGFIYDASNTANGALVEPRQITTGAVDFIYDGTAAGWGAPALANGDVILFTFQYEAA